MNHSNNFNLLTEKKNQFPKNIFQTHTYTHKKYPPDLIFSLN